MSPARRTEFVVDTIHLRRAGDISATCAVPGSKQSLSSVTEDSLDPGTPQHDLSASDTSAASQERFTPTPP